MSLIGPRLWAALTLERCEWLYGRVRCRFGLTDHGLAYCRGRRDHVWCGDRFKVVRGA